MFTVTPAHPNPQPSVASCPLCAGTRLYYLFSIGAERVTRCHDCGLLAAPREAAFSDEQPTPDVPPAELLRPLVSYHGTSTGSLWLVSEENNPLGDAARKLGFKVTVGGELPDGHERTLDVVILGDRLNWSFTPEKLLADVRRVLRPDGVVMVWTPALARWCGEDSGPTALPLSPAGRYYFNETTLQSFLFRSSFRQLRVQPTHSRVRRVQRGDEGYLVLGRLTPERAIPLLSIIVAIYNEAATAAAALDKITAKCVSGLAIEVIIVESNSTDGTREIVQRYADRSHVKLVFEDCPRGKGRAVREGLQHAQGDFVLIQDADLEYDLEDYDLLLEPLLTGRAAFVLGARHGGQTWKIRRFNDQPMQAMLLNLAHRGFTALINLSLGLSLSDPFTMYKVFRRDCIHGLKFECNRFDFDWEILIKLVRKGYRPLEIPVNYRSRSFKEGKKIRMFRDPLTWLRAWAKSRFGPLS